MRNEIEWKGFTLSTNFNDISHQTCAMRKCTGMVAQIHNPNPWEAEAGELPLFCCLLGIPSEFHASLGYREMFKQH